MDSQTTFFIIGALVIIGFGLIYLQIKKLVDSKSQDETTKLLTQLISDMRGSMDKTTDSMVRQTTALPKTTATTTGALDFPLLLA